jgi:uncharacterized protein YijF (DUF1287 family)
MSMTRFFIIIVLASASSWASCRHASTPAPAVYSATQASAKKASGAAATPLEKMIADGVEQTTYTVTYDPAYVKLDYPMGDVPLDRGACSDVIIRAFRKAGVDLQATVHEDMKQNFAVYPKRWGLSEPDSNIDHRRVANLMTYFERAGKAQKISNDAQDYLPGDVVTWDLGGGQLHVGLVTDQKSPISPNYLIVHNIGAGAQIQDVLFAWRITGHYRSFPVEQVQPEQNHPKPHA